MVCTLVGLIVRYPVFTPRAADRLLQLLQREREYIQLHRDSTVSSLTVSPSVVEGRIVWDDSPLVKAAKFGRILVVDEADKAQPEVTSVLKGLVEDGEMLLADGRRLVSSDRATVNSTAMDIPIHPEFGVWVLANRPGFPFLGNDFFRECGDVFATHVRTSMAAGSDCLTQL